MSLVKACLKKRVVLIDYEKIIDYGTDEEKEAVKSKIQVGVFQDEKKPGFFEAYDILVDRLVEIDDRKAQGGSK